MTDNSRHDRWRGRCTFCGAPMCRSRFDEHMRSEWHQRAVREWDERHATKKAPPPVVKPEEAEGVCD